MVSEPLLTSKRTDSECGRDPLITFNYTLTHLADHSEDFSHDIINRYLAGDRIPPRLVWEDVKPYLYSTLLETASFVGAISRSRCASPVGAVRNRTYGLDA